MVVFLEFAEERNHFLETESWIAERHWDQRQHSWSCHEEVESEKHQRPILLLQKRDRQTNIALSTVNLCEMVEAHTIFSMLLSNATTLKLEKVSQICARVDVKRTLILRALS